MKLPTLFNCSNDMALAANVSQYFPPKRILQMENELASLAQYWDEGPWGWSPATKRHYQQMGIDECELPTDEWLQEVRKLSSRAYAAEYIQQLLNDLQDERLLGSEMCFHTNIPDSVSGSQGRIYKSPWSSSGRGVFVDTKLTDKHVRERLNGYLRTQGGYLSDRFYNNKALDFAMEFQINPAHDVTFLGYSVFSAAESGAYGYNYVESQEQLLQRIDADASLLQHLINYHIRHLGQTEYIGPVGIDMLKTTDGCIHPCIEINLRMNMGILAIKLHERFGDNASVELTPTNNAFQAVIDEGKLMIKYNS